MAVWLRFLWEGQTVLVGAITTNLHGLHSDLNRDRRNSI
jgi:hypothetical protein